MEVTTINTIQAPPIHQDENTRHVSGPNPGRKPEHEDAAIQTKKTDDNEQLDNAVGEINKFLDSMNTSLHFYIDKDSGRIAVKVIDNKTQEVIKEIPSEEALRLAANMKNISGLIVDKST